VAERVQARQIDDEGARPLRIVWRENGPLMTRRRTQTALLSAQIVAHADSGLDDYQAGGATAAATKMPVSGIAEMTFSSPDRVRDEIIQRRRVRRRT
jgi:hypothetical protein